MCLPSSDYPGRQRAHNQIRCQERLLVAASEYLELAPPLRWPQDLGAHACLVYSQDGGPAEWPLRGAAPLLVDGSFRVNNSVMLRDLLLAGLGVTLTPDFVVADLLSSGQLFRERWPHSWTLSAVSWPRSGRPARARCSAASLRSARRPRRGGCRRDHASVGSTGTTMQPNQMRGPIGSRRAVTRCRASC
jgi:DNA-binding transcriptional LysR family regulator